MVAAPGVIRRHALRVILVEELTAARRARIAAVDAAEQQQSA
jgi:hypothetical protein